MGHVPNAISLLRALAVIPVVVALDAADPGFVPLVIFAAAAATDAVDGPLARRLRATSRLGAFLDPLADKVLVLGALGGLLARGAVDPLPVALILVREVAITGLRAIAAGRGTLVSSTVYGKAKAGLQGTAVGAVLVSLAWPELGLGPIAGAVLWGATVVTVASGADVVRRAAAMHVSDDRRGGTAVRAHAR